MPTLLLLHGWTASADLNFFTCYGALGAEYNVVAIDHRGHGRGIRTRKILRLEHCADDAIAACEALGIERVIPVGYSMGGIIAQLVWRRQRAHVAGLVLCATSGFFVRSREERLSLLGISGLAALARLTPAQARRWLTEQLYLQRRAEHWEPWAIEEASLHDWRTVLEAGKAIGNFSSRAWIGDVDVPTAVVITMRDRVVPVRRQMRLFETIPGAEAFRVDGDHDVVISNPSRFVPVLLQACARVAQRAL
jgi:3-oxoadipate enol-lactonase